MNEFFGISVVIPTYQRCTSVIRTLASPSPDYSEHRVRGHAIDGSVDGTRELVAGSKRLTEHSQLLSGRASAQCGHPAFHRRSHHLPDDDMEPTLVLSWPIGTHTPGLVGALWRAPILRPPSWRPPWPTTVARGWTHACAARWPGYVGLREMSMCNLCSADVILEVGGFG
jgi:hypothetical protein